MSHKCTYRGSKRWRDSDMYTVEALSVLPEGLNGDKIIQEQSACDEKMTVSQTERQRSLTTPMETFDFTKSGKLGF